MRIEERFAVRAPAAQVWDLLLDVPGVARCIPGVEEFEPVGEGVYEGRIRLKVGPISAHFRGRITITEVNPDGRRAAFVAEAADGLIASTVRMTQSFQLEPLPGGGTELTLGADIDVRGKLAQLGWGLIRPKVTDTMRQFAANLKALCEEAAAG